MASAKREAQRQLGSVNDYINLKGLNQERSLANDVYKTNTTSFQNAYNDLLNTINSNRGRAKTDFGSGRSAVSENAYLQNRQDISDLASRGLSGGIAQLSKVRNRMETGRQFSDLANTYYNTMNELAATEKTGTNEYNTQMETAKNTLNAALADINAREKAGRNAYKAAVAQLAEQIQARRDAAAAAARALALQRQQNSNSAMQKLKDNLSTMSFGEASDYLVKSGIVKNTKAAVNWLKNNTVIRPEKGGAGIQGGYTIRQNTNTKPNKSFKWTDLLSILGPKWR